MQKRLFGLVLKRCKTSLPLGTQREVVSDPLRTRPSPSDFQTTAGELFDQYMKGISTLWSQVVDKVINKHKGKNLSL